MALGLDQPTEQVRAVLQSIDDKREYCRRLFAYFKVKNAQSGANLVQAAWSHSRLRALNTTIGGLSVTLDVINLVNTGELELVYAALEGMTVDDGSLPYHWLTQTRVDDIKDELKIYLGLAG